MATGIFLTMVLLAVLAYVAKERRQQSVMNAPTLRILTPAPGAVVDSPLTIQFVSPEPLRLRSTGWGVRNLHVHARINSIEYMPAATEIAVTDSIYSWTLPGVSPGELSIVLGWADAAHRELASSASNAIQATLR